MKQPGISDFNAALHDPSRGLIPAELKGGTVRRTPFGSPQPISGGFNLIYEYTLPGGGKKAIRCFIEEHPASRERLPSLLLRLSQLRKEQREVEDLFLETRWIDECLATPAGTSAAVVMDWARGKTLGAWLDEHYTDSAAITGMREKIFRLITLFQELGIAHGDLQGGNIMVSPDGTLRVIDYDGLRFFDEADVPAWEAGHPDFQHPDRGRDIPPEITDRFSAIVLDLGLAVTAELPDLYKRHSTGENLVFLREDYLDPGASPVLAELKKHSRFRYGAEWFSSICLDSPESVPDLAEFRGKAYAESPAPTVQAPSSPSPSTLPPALTLSPTPTSPPRRKREYMGPYPVYSGTDFYGISGEEGHRIEVVGRIDEVHRGKTKYGKPYIFISFDDWREDSFRVVIWSEGLETFRVQPSSAWEGRWISIMGLVDEPYVKTYMGEETVYYSITVHDSSQVHTLSPEQARYRLGREDKEDKVTAPEKRPSNQELLQKLRGGSPDSYGGNTFSSPNPAAAPARHTSSTQPYLSSIPSSPASPPSPKKRGVGCWVTIVFTGIIILIVLITGL